MLIDYSDFKAVIWTGLYSDRAFECLHEIFNSLNLAQWSVRRDNTGQVAVVGHISLCSGATSKTLARIIKRFVQTNKNHSISIQSTDGGEEVIAQEAYFLCDFLNLLKEKTLKKRYGEDFYNAMVGSQRDPFTIEKLNIKDDLVRETREHFAELRRKERTRLIGVLYDPNATDEHFAILEKIENDEYAAIAKIEADFEALKVE